MSHETPDETPDEIRDGSRDDSIRDRIRDYAFAPGGSGFDGAQIRRRAHLRRRRRIWSAIAAIVVTLALAGGVIALVLQGRVTSLEYADQLPSPSPSVSTIPFAPEPSQFENLPTGSVGSVLDGLRIDDVVISVVDCRENEPCPDTATITVTNESAEPFRGPVIFSVYRNGRPTVGDGASVALDPGASTTVSITVQPELSRNIPPTQRGGTYTWNIAVERQ